MSHRVILTSPAKKQLAKLPNQVQKAISAAVQSLSEGLNHNCKKLAGRDRTYRLRVGDYRVVFQMENLELVIIVIRIAHRREVYRQ